MLEVARGIEVESLANSDVSLYGMSWSNDGINLTLDIALGGGERHFLEFTWAGAISVSLDSKAREGGAPLSRESKYEVLDEGRIRVRFDFADRGLFQAECQDLVLRKKSE